MSFQSTKGTVPVSKPAVNQEEYASAPLQAHKLSVHFDVVPEISYLDDDLCVLLVDVLPLLDGFPEAVWISQQRCDVGFDFCQLNFWAFSEDADAIKEFAIWFQEIFRDPVLSDLLERFVSQALEQPTTADVVLSDWTRVRVTADEVWETAEEEMRMRTEKER